MRETAIIYWLRGKESDSNGISGRVYLAGNILYLFKKITHPYKSHFSPQRPFPHPTVLTRFYNL